MTEEQKDTQKLKKVWKKLKEDQETSYSRMHKSKSAGAISDVKVVEKDGQKKVEISTVNGGKIYDDGSKAAEFHSMKPEEKISASKLEALIQQVLNEGWASTVDDLTPDVVRQLKKACEAKGIKTFGNTSEKAEKEHAEKMNENLNKKRENEAKQQRNQNNNDGEKKLDLFARREEAQRAVSEIMEARKKVEASHRRYDNSVQKMKNKIISDEKKRCEDFLKELREETFKKFIEETRDQLYGSSHMSEKIAEKKKKGIKLTSEEAKLDACAVKYGLSADPKKDTKTLAEQKKMFALKDLNPNAKKAYDEKAKYFRGVRDTKIVTLERNAAEVELAHMQGENIEFTEESFRKFAYRYLPMDYTDKKAMENARKSCFEKIGLAKGEKTSIRRKNLQESNEKIAAEFLNRGLTLDGQELQASVEGPSMMKGLHGRIMEKNNILKEKENNQQSQVRSSFSQAIQAKMFAERFGR
ncbi:MAG: hypothetical protein MJ250_04735 [Alphaproteobacteria bacterium]|nr:hypothetical protein [Alphaproteobacteria bacterium]